MLVFLVGSATPKAVPLGLVARIEEIAVGKIEASAAGQTIVQYRGKLMPLVLPNGAQIKADGLQPVLVFADGERSMGLVVDEVVDIVETTLAVEMRSDGAGFLGSAIINGNSTDVIDVAYYLTQAYQDWFSRPRLVAGTAAPRQRILVVEDNAFFRDLLTPLLTSAGYEVVEAASAKDALDMHEGGEDFDVIVSETDLSGVSGFDFAQTVRAGGRWQQVPLVALSASSSSEDIERGREAGFTSHVAKLDRDALLSTIGTALTALKGAA